ncbi:division/cell wall cluster transcriptional repressor MraZ [Sutterella sp.]|uniref:division/cell wall cluster transcriptional repressor MraZ n=1 Tax=Sutterella sp. TaxID=1981025 RepID=UPI0026DF85E5|nr:division/cell wall cluster transcriptional repressor MraZ [Sutterella sp.]MDO5530844.1 division/cell wall cluster transcriptional repressor MraZ [Sutterella sp.]
MFQGTSNILLDDKGRLALPRHLRGEIEARGGTLVATRHPDGCLVLYPREAWTPRREKLLALPWSARGFVRLVLGSAVELKPDAAGRVLIPSELREAAGLGRECALVGLGEHFELWDRARLRENEAEALAAGVDAGDFTF